MIQKAPLYWHQRGVISLNFDFEAHNEGGCGSIDAI